MQPPAVSRITAWVAQDARSAVQQGIGLVIVAGGDGTIKDVAGQLVGSETTLGIIPLGTMNNLARSLGVPLNLDAACALLHTGISRHIDVGQIITADHPRGWPHPSGRERPNCPAAHWPAAGAGHGQWGCQVRAHAQSRRYPSRGQGYS